ncbi:hypothetical protein [Pseudoalteromonas sp. R3]|uniref:hypothetical protein n=1 Tax=Pseudoalteromonas sp. R3 TaxID=1709477 RepID=UPI0006B659D0|nr:hypothetical protein [Pseudoalteromonas sp. R3]AZZ98611.1 hypothetical protein ELR70_16730 [Pseudoalteromonas sp. R3]
MSDRIIGECNSNGCKEILYINEVKASTACSRRPTIITPPSWALKVLEHEVLKYESIESGVIFELTIPIRYWSGKTTFNSYDEYLSYVSDEAKHSYIEPKLKVLTGNSMSSIVEGWEGEVRDAYLRDLMWRTLDWLSLIVSLVCLVVSVIWFGRWLSGKAGAATLVSALTFQALILYAAFYSMSSWSNFMVGLAGVVVPGIWFYQLIQWVLKVYAKRSLNK